MKPESFAERGSHHAADGSSLYSAGRVLQLTPVLVSTGGIESCVRQLSDDLVARGLSTLVLSGDLLAPVDSCGKGWSARPASFGDAATVLGEAQRFEPDLVVFHYLANDAVHEVFRGRYMTVEVVHTTLCWGGKLFRRHDQLCHHPVGVRCMIDWYAGPCGSTPSPLVAVRSLAVARSHIRALGHLDSVLVGSNFMREYLIGEGIAPELVSVVNLQGDEATGPSYSRARPKAGGVRAKSSVGDLYRLLFVGRVVYGKGLQYLIKALTHLDASFVLDVAGDGWYLSRAKALVQELGLDDRVEFLGNLDRSMLDTVYSSADLVVVPSIMPEPVGLVVGEARRRGLTVVVSDAGGLPEWAAGGTGVRVAPRADACGLAATLRAVRSATATPAPLVAARPVPPRLVDAVTALVRSARSSSEGDRAST